MAATGKGLTICLIHKGFPFYLNYVIHQAHATNPDLNIVLLGDDQNRAFPFVEHRRISDYWEAARKFEEIYSHFSTNDKSFELFCLQRWFVFAEYAQQNLDGPLLCLDSDAMLYCTLTQERAVLVDCDFSVCDGIGPQFLYWRDASVLQAFTSFITSAYQDPRALALMAAHYRSVLRRESTGGVSDMLLLWAFSVRGKFKFRDLGRLPAGGVFDPNFEANPFGMEMSGKGKTLYWNLKHPYYRSRLSGQLIRALGIHFGGGMKPLTKKYFTGRLSWNLMINAVTIFFRRVSRALQNRWMRLWHSI